MTDDNGYRLDKEPEEWRCAFVVGVDTNGIAHVSPKVDEFLRDKVFEREATPSDLWLAATQVKKDLEEISIAQRVLFNMQMLGQAMAQQAEANAILRGTDGGLKMPPGFKG